MESEKGRAGERLKNHMSQTFKDDKVEVQKTEVTYLGSYNQL